jgi:hypothetical protein
MHPDGEPTVAALLEQAAALVRTGALEQARAILAEAGGRLEQVDAGAELLARALWLAAEVALREDDLDGFHRNARAAVDTLEAAGHGDRGAALHREWTRIAERLMARQMIELEGPVGVLRVMAHQSWRLLGRLRGELDWREVERDRALLAELVVGPRKDQPFLRLVRGLGLDELETALVAVLGGFAYVPALADAARAVEGGEAGEGVSCELLVTLLSPRAEVRREALARLADGAPLRRYGVVRAHEGGARVTLEPQVMWFLHGVALLDRSMPPGITTHASAPGAVPIDVLLRDSLAELERSLAAPRSAVIAVEGRPGSGRRTLTLAAAAGAGRPALVVEPDRVTDDPERLRRTAVREALVHGATLYLGLDDRDPAPWLELADEPGLRLVIGVTPARAQALIASLRARRSDLVRVRLEPLPEAAVALAWNRALVELGQPALSRSELAGLSRAGLVIGDLHETVTEAVVRADAAGAALDPERLAAVLAERTRAELAAVATPLAPTGQVEPAVAGWIDRLLASQTLEPGWTGAAARRPVGLAAGGSARQRCSVGVALAERLGTAAWLVDAGARAPAVVIEAIAAAARAGAVLVIGGLERRGEDAAIAEAIDGRLCTAVLAVEAVPLWLGARADAELRLEGDA